MNLFKRLRGWTFPQRISTLTEEDRRRECTSLQERLDELGYTVSPLQLTVKGKRFVSFYLPEETELNELTDIIEHSSEESPFSVYGYVTGFCSAYVDNNFVNLLFYRTLEDGKDGIDKTLTTKDLTNFQFRMMVALYYLDLAEEQNLVIREDEILYRKNYDSSS